MGEYVSGDYFSGLAVRPATGRMIVAGDDQVGSSLVAVVSLKFSERHYGGPANAAGQTILINNVPAMVVGVTPPEFFGVDPSTAPDVYLPMRSGVSIEAADPYGTKPKWYLDQNFYWVEIMARLRPGVSRAQAQAALAPQFSRWVESTVTNEREREILPSLVVQEGAGGVEALRRRYSQPLYVLMTLVGLILAIACCNIASLLLARATARRGEMALRLSLGAGRLRLVRQLLTESVMLASFGGILGVFIAVWGIRFLTVMLANGQTDFTLHANLNWHVLSVTAALALLTGILFGLAPALQSTRVDVVPALRKLRSTDARSRMRFSLSHALVVSQIALSLLMLVAAGLFVRTLKNLQSVEVGFNRENVLLFELDARKAGHKDPGDIPFLQRPATTIQRGPGCAKCESVAGFSNHGRHRLQDHRERRAARSGHAHSIYWPRLLKDHADSNTGRARNRRARPTRLPAGCSRQRVVCQDELRRSESAGPARPLGNRPPRHGDRRCGQERAIWRTEKQFTAGCLHSVQSRRTAATADGLRVAHGRKSARIGKHSTRNRAPSGRARAQSPTSGPKLRTSTRQLTRRSSLPSCARPLPARIDHRLRGSLWDRFLQCRSPYQRDWHSHGAGGAARRGGLDGPRRGLRACRRGPYVSVPAAFATSQFLKSFLFRMKPNDPLSMIFAIGTLLISVLLAGYLPARKASQIDPMVALRHE